MLQGLRLASPSPVKQGPNAMALMKSTQLIVEGKPLSTPPMAQDYFEPGVNTKLNRRKTPKTNYDLPSNLPKYPLGFVPLNQTPGAAGEEPPEIRVKEALPADLLDVFAKISAQQMAESKAIEQAKVIGGMDIGSMIAQQYKSALSEKTMEAKLSGLLQTGFTEEESVEALKALRMEEAMKVAKEPPKPVPVERAIEEALGVATESIRQEREKSVRELEAIKASVKAVGSKEKKLAVAKAKAKAEVEEGLQAPLEMFFPPVKK